VGDMGYTEAQALVGQADRLVQVSHHDSLDLSGLLTPTQTQLLTAPPDGPRYFREFNPPPPERSREHAAEQLAAGGSVIVEEEATTAKDRNLGPDLAGLIARARTGLHGGWEGALGRSVSGGNGSGNGDPRLPQDDPLAPGDGSTMVDLSFTKGAAAGSGLAAFTLDGVRIKVVGGAQDGVGKCALGGDITVLKAQNAAGDRVGGHVGKSFAYGAQRGLFLIQGDADARAGIRLSGADMVIGGTPRQAIDDKLGTLGARANCKGFAFEYMTGGRAVVLGDPGPWLCSGMTGGVVYVRQNDEMGLDERAIRRRLSKAAKVSLDELLDPDIANVRELLSAYQSALRESGQDNAARAVTELIEDPAANFIAINPVTQQADPSISTE
jgi:glutamate synthase (NADPH/NADH) large chain